MDNTNTQEDLYNTLNIAYTTALYTGKANNRKTYADYIGISEDTLSRAFKKDPRYLTKNLIARIERIESQAVPLWSQVTSHTDTSQAFNRYSDVSREIKRGILDKLE